MSREVEVQLHLWPWSAGNPRRWPEDKDGETVDLIDGTASFPFYGSPVISVSSQVDLFLPRRHERFSPFGSFFTTDQEQYRLHEAPHGILTGMKGKDDPMGYISMHSPLGRVRIHLQPEGAKPRITIRDGNKAKAAELYGAVLSWSHQFEALIKTSRSKGQDSKLSWGDVLEHFLIDLDKTDEPRMALIVKIAEDMSKKMSLFVHAARKILLRERHMVPAGQVAEIDTRCLRWLGRQPGETLAQKATSHKQRLLGVVRRESFDTLENRVLKDFLGRCAGAAAQYLDIEVGDNLIFRASKRAKEVRGFRHLCSMLHTMRHMENVLPPPTGLRPNYVLQNDFRYRQVWRNYIRLLRREDEQDRLWDWQCRTWADVVRIMICITIYKQYKIPVSDAAGSIQVDEVLTSSAHFLVEQHLGCRINPGCEPGPFVINLIGREQSKASVLEIVHPDQADRHPATKDFGLLGGHLYLVMTPLSGGRSTVIVVWAVHTAGAEKHPDWGDIGRSAGQALQRQEILLGRRPGIPRLKGFIAASDLKAKGADVHPGVNGGLNLVQVAANPRWWPDALAGMELALENVLGRTL